MDTISTARAFLRPLAAEDEALYCSIYCDPLLMRHVAESLSAEEARESFAIALRQAMASAPANWWAIVDRASLQSIGLLGANQAEQAFEIGIMLQAGAQGQGYAADAIAGLARYLFDGHDAASVAMRHAPDNDAMRGVARRLGFENVSTNAMQTVWRLERAASGSDAEPSANFALPHRAR